MNFFCGPFSKIAGRGSFCMPFFHFCLFSKPWSANLKEPICFFLRNQCFPISFNFASFIINRTKVTKNLAMDHLCHLWSPLSTLKHPF